jgi:hypothetical protein
LKKLSAHFALWGEMGRQFFQLTDPHLSEEGRNKRISQLDLVLEDGGV